MLMSGTHSLRVIPILLSAESTTKAYVTSPIHCLLNYVQYHLHYSHQIRIQAVTLSLALNILRSWGVKEELGKWDLGRYS